MDRRDYIIIFCLLLPFFITLPLYLTTRSQLGDQREITERVRDSLYTMEYRYAKLASGEAKASDFPKVKVDLEQASTPEAVPASTAPVAAIEETITPETPAPTVSEEVTATSRPQPLLAANSPAPRLSTSPAPAAAPSSMKAKSDPVEEAPATETVVAKPILTAYHAKPGKANDRTQAQIAALADKGVSSRSHSMLVRLDTTNNRQTLEFNCQLRELPADYTGSREVYLVISDAATGDAISGLDDINATVPVGGVRVPIWSAARKKLTLSPNRRVNISTELTRNLPAGSYLVELFSESGPLVKTVLDFEASPASMLGK